MRLVAVLVVLLTTLPAAAFARTQYFCRMMDRVMQQTCCCSKQKQQSTQSVVPEVRKADCCERIQAADRGSVPATRAALTDVPPPALISTVQAFPAFLENDGRKVAWATQQARAPPRVGPPLFLKYCALLT